MPLTIEKSAEQDEEHFPKCMVGEQVLCPVSCTVLVWCSKELTFSQTTNFRLFQTKRVCRKQFPIQ